MQEEFSARFRRSPVKRAKRRGLLRNVAMALGRIASAEDATQAVRGRVGEALRRRGEVEDDEWVREELSLATRG